MQNKALHLHRIDQLSQAIQEVLVKRGFKDVEGDPPTVENTGGGNIPIRVGGVNLGLVPEIRENFQEILKEAVELLGGRIKAVMRE